MIQITKDSSRKQRCLKRIIIVLLIVVGISMVAFGSIVCNKLRQPQNYIEEYGTEQGLAALIYGEKGLSSLPIQDITGEHIDTDNEYMYYYSVEFIK